MWRLVCVLAIIPLIYSLRIATAGNRVLHDRSRRLKLAANASGKDDIGWDSHRAVHAIPDSLVKEIDGNEGMRAKFEHLCRTSQVLMKQVVLNV